MKYMVTFSCGHKAEVNLFGPTAERERKIAYYEKQGTCPQCFAELRELEKSIGCDEVEMPYKRYKTEFADCKTTSNAGAAG